MKTLRYLVAALLLISQYYHALTANEVYQVIGPDLDREALDRGDVVWVPLPDNETSDRALTGVLLVRIHAPLDTVMAAMANEPAMQLGETMAIASDEDWNRVANFLQPTLTDNERERLASTDASDAFYLNANELQRLQQSNADASTLAQAWQHVLQQRMQDYQAHGFSSTASIASHDEVVLPAEQLADATNSMVFLRKNFPAFINHLRDYPKNHDAFPDQFFVSIEQEDNRPVYSLKHQITDIQPNHALIAERQFYVSHSLDSLQVTILCLRDGEHTLVGLLNHVFTGKVSGMGQMIAHRIGRAKAKEKVEPMFEALRERFRE